jgi:hypothetical protein
LPEAKACFWDSRRLLQLASEDIVFTNQYIQVYQTGMPFTPAIHGKYPVFGVWEAQRYTVIPLLLHISAFHYHYKVWQRYWVKTNQNFVYKQIQNIALSVC